MTKILLVEDDKSLREIYGVRLLAEGYDIVSAGDGEEALAMAIKERPQLIVSDVMMPKISGFDMLDILRSTTETKDIKVIMMTALSSEDQRQRGEQLGADRYLVKSQVGIEDVVRTVHDVLGDVPTATPTAQQTFGTPGPSAAARPATPSVPTRPALAPVPADATGAVAVTPQQPVPEPTPAAIATEPQIQIPVTPEPAAPLQPVAPAPQPAPVAPAPEPQQPITIPVQAAPQLAPVPQDPAVQPAAPQPSTAPTPDTALPQPTAPFSTPRPASLGERVIHPLEASEQPTDDVAARIDMELSGMPQISQPPTPPVPGVPDSAQQPPVV